LELRGDRGYLHLGGGAVLAAGLELRLLVLDLLDDGGLLRVLGIERHLHRLDRGPLLLELDHLDAGLTDDGGKEDGAIQQVGETLCREDQFERVDLAGLVHRPHPQPEVDDVLLQLRLLDGQLALGDVDLGRRSRPAPPSPA